VSVWKGENGEREYEREENYMEQARRENRIPFGINFAYDKGYKES
jgi:hypothetical protein